MRGTNTYCDLLFYLRSECVCANSLVLRIQGNKKKIRKTCKNQKNLDREKEGICQQILWKTLYFGKNKYFVLVLLHVKNCPWSPPAWLENWGHHTERHRACLRFLIDSQRDRKQLPECGHLSSLNGTLRFGGVGRSPMQKGIGNHQNMVSKNWTCSRLQRCISSLEPRTVDFF